MQSKLPPLTIIEAKKGWVPIDIRELWRSRELLYFLVKRDIQVRYKQTLLGGLWALIQPLFSMLVLTLFFGKLARIPSDGVPYPIFVYIGLLPWTYFANSLTAAGNSLVGSANLLTKIYFPRLIIPASAALSGLLDFFIAMTVLVALMIYYHFLPGLGLLLLPLLIILTFACSLGCGLWLSALNVRYRDIRYVIPFMVQLWMFLSPIIYPVSLVQGRYQWLFSLNPMGGVISAYRASILGKQSIDWVLLGLSSTLILLILISGLYYYKRMERTFADLV